MLWQLTVSVRNNLEEKNKHTVGWILLGNAWSIMIRETHQWHQCKQFLDTFIVITRLWRFLNPNTPSKTNIMEPNRIDVFLFWMFFLFQEVILKLQPVVLVGVNYTKNPNPWIRPAIYISWGGVVACGGWAPPFTPSSSRVTKSQRRKVNMNSTNMSEFSPCGKQVWPVFSTVVSQVQITCRKKAAKTWSNLCVNSSLFM